MDEQLAARAQEILLLDVTSTSPTGGPRWSAKGGDAEPVGWDTARLLPRYLAAGPLFLAARQPPAPSRQPARGDVDPENGFARLSYRRAGRSTRCATAASPSWPRPASNCPSSWPSPATPASAPLELYARPTFKAVAAATARLEAASRRINKDP